MTQWFEGSDDFAFKFIPFSPYSFPRPFRSSSRNPGRDGQWRVAESACSSAWAWASGKFRKKLHRLLNHILGCFQNKILKLIHPDILILRSLCYFAANIRACGILSEVLAADLIPHKTSQSNSRSDNEVRQERGVARERKGRWEGNRRNEMG